MWKGFGVCIVSLVCLASGLAAVIRPGQEPQDQYETTTIVADISTTAEPETDATTEPIGWASVDPAPGTVAGDLSVPRLGSTMRSAKLLLLSTPAKRPVEVEQQLEESDESDSAAAGSGEGSLPTTTESSRQQPEGETTTESSEATTTTTTSEALTVTESGDRKTTKLFAINATISSQDSAEPSVAVAVVADNATVAIAEQPLAGGVHNNNAAVELALVEPEADYVLVDASLDLDETELAALSAATHDELQLGSFTHIDSDAHLQPVVHSVEIVPTRLDDPLIVNYVHNFR